jgi:hypothetical protein
MQSRLQETIDHLREDIGKVVEPQLDVTSANLDGLDEPMAHQPPVPPMRRLHDRRL